MAPLTNPGIKTPHNAQCLKGSRLKKERQKGPARPQMVDYLPTEMVTEIVIRVAARSAADLFRCKLSCKMLHEIADEKPVLQHVAIEDLHSCRWRNPSKFQSFFDRCRIYNNPGALYELGMVQYFRHMMVVEGLKNLEEAATRGHVGATYALGLILLCNDDEQCISKGVELLWNLMNLIKGEQIVELRKKLNVALCIQLNLETGKEIAADVSEIVLDPKITCAMGELHEIENSWDRGVLEEYSHDYSIGGIEDKIACQACKCSREAAIFCKLVRDTRNWRSLSVV